MDTVTLDTNIVRDWLWIEGKLKDIRYGNEPKKKTEISNNIDDLKKLINNNSCHVAVTTQIYTDFEVDKLPPPINNFVREVISIASPSISTFPWIFPVIWVDLDELTEILKDLFPNINTKDKKFRNKEKDALQIYAHKMSSRDYFITSDEGILRRAKTMKDKWGVTIISLDEYLLMKGDL